MKGSKDDLTARLSLGYRLREIRTAQGRTLVDVATATGTSASYVSDVERGKSTPSLDWLERWASGMGITVVEALSGVWPYDAVRRPRLAEPADGRSTAGK